MYDIEKLAASVAALHVVMQVLVSAAPDKQKLRNAFERQVEQEEANLLGRAYPEAFIEEVSTVLALYKELINSQSG